jgi:hypothetical protein
MTPEEKKKMADLEAKVATLAKENEDFKTSNTKLGEDIKERDTKITELKTQAGERAEQFKKFKDMTDAEKDLLTEKEKELLLRQEKLEEDQAKFQQETAERNAKDRSERIEALAEKFAKGDKDLKEQIKINLGKLNPELVGKAVSDVELTPFIQDALNLTGAGANPDPLRDAHNHEGAGAPVSPVEGFGATKEGKDLSGAMGLSQATPAGVKAIEVAGEAK